MQALDAVRRAVLFYRNFAGFTGGHLKVWDYYNHVRSSPRHQPFVCFSSKTIWDQSNPWLGVEGIVESWNAIDPDILFLGGVDWQIVAPEARERSSIPIINIIQGVRHAEPGDERYEFLRYKAIRICLTDAVADALAKSGRVNGPVYVIPNGIDLGGLPAPLPRADRDIDVLISALKQPELGGALCRRLEAPGRRIELLPGQIPRPQFLALVNRARVVLHLPSRIGGFCLPALESMALATVLVCPDCVGNRSWCIPGDNCFRPEYDFDSLARDTEKALDLPAATRDQMLARGRHTVAQHDQLAERRAFLELLDNVDQLW